MGVHEDKSLCHGAFALRLPSLYAAASVHALAREEQFLGHER